MADGGQHQVLATYQMAQTAGNEPFQLSHTSIGSFVARTDIVDNRSVVFVYVEYDAISAGANAIQSSTPT